MPVGVLVPGSVHTKVALILSLLWSLLLPVVGLFAGAVKAPQEEFFTSILLILMTLREACMLFEVAAAAVTVPLASLSACGPHSQLRMILFSVEFLRSILLFMFVHVHLLLPGPLTRFGFKVFPFFVLWESLTTRSPFGTCQRFSVNGLFLPWVSSWSFSFAWSSVVFGSKVFSFFVLGDSLSTWLPFGTHQ